MVLLPRQLNSYIRSFETTQLKFWMKTQTFSKLFLEFHQRYWIKSKHLISRGDITSTYHENLQNINFRNLLWNKYSRNIARKNIEILNHNPYILCDYGVRIADVDRIVKNPQQSIQRSAAIIQNALEQYEYSGNVCMPYSIYQKTVKQLSVSMKAAPSTLSEAEELLLNTEAVIYYNGAAYRKKMFVWKIILSNSSTGSVPVTRPLTSI